MCGRFDERTGPAVNVLPASVEYHDDAENQLLQFALCDVNVDALEFKLTPTYITYMAVRHRLIQPNMDHRQRANIIAALTTKVANTAYYTIEV